MKARYIDAHCHLHEFKDEDIRSILESLDVLIVAVSDDLESARRTLNLYREYPDRIKPCLGLHPWSVGEVEAPLEQAREIVRLAAREGVDCIGEVGLDTRFVPQTIDKQREVFSIFLDYAADVDAFMNLHTAGTWEEVYNIVTQRGLKRANFHWYTGPHHLLEKLRESGYVISVNPAVKIQKKHQEIVKMVPLEMILVESDGPYQYRGLNLTPLLIPDTIRVIAELRRESEEAIMEAVQRNAARVLRI
ncbi:TatD-related deoxyribonuclease [Pyrolobus fumarii 1A]|uniref:TatD-related deoxyribonuclease n=1 Tax=Pyrolobus fumarii (strain DSM 11204 / 1A) TaxID=694429 RepID=G0EDT1_PYRF1|nr:TatD family hydrolase [Pyrolobus fumarii]AEM38700.1 TatD-related deoxyribonuclease [Pyrolobus fumarii 1A]